jgi:hypothetical protein
VDDTARLLLYYGAATSCVVAIVLALLGWTQGVVFLGLGGAALIVGAARDWRAALAMPADLEGKRGLKARLVGLALIGVIWIVTAVRVVT